MKEGPVNEFEFEAGYPTAEASEALYDEMDYQRAVQAYIWATPMINSMAMRAAFAEYGVTEHDRRIMAFEYSLLPQHIWMTANSTTPYFWTLMDVRESGPMVVEIPPQDVLGGFYGFWMRALEDFGLPGPDRGEGGRYLVLPPGYEGAVPDGFFVVESVSNLVWCYGRANGAQFKGAPSLEVFEKLNLYPLAEADDPPPPAGVVAVGEEPIDTDWPKDYEAWKLIHEGMQLDNVRAQDKIIYDFLRGVGIEHGRPFEPDARQRQVLERAADTGHKMVMNLAFNNRNPEAPRWPDREWVNILTCKNRLFEMETYDEVTDRVQWYQLVANGKYVFDAANREPIYGAGSAYLSSYKDNTGAFLSGSSAYRLKVPASVPIANFWSVTVYDNETRSMIRNDQQRIDRGSTDDLEINGDGTVDLYFSPTLPDGVPESNWVQTNSGNGWFVLFRFYGPEKPYYDRTWKLNDMEKLG